jgi:nitroimidazol reductase NimA-like FMN-containing flavoprotein (pyridoxamine 5'-phosphate oxidase superfamily)
LFMSVKDMQKFMSAASMSEKEIQEFLSIPRLARMATIQNGKPHLVPVWYFYDGTNIMVSAPKGTKKTKNLQSNPNVSIIIDLVDGELKTYHMPLKPKL